MKVLHLLANYKWTGPADPAIRAADQLRREGCDAVFALPEWTHPGAEPRVRMELSRRNLPVIAGLRLRKHFHLRDLVSDVRQLSARLAAGQFGLVHCHLPGDHLLAALAVARAGVRVPIVRSLYDPVAPALSPRTLFAFGRTAAVVVPTDACAGSVRRRYGVPRESVLTAPPPVEADVFSPRGTGPDLRPAWGVEASFVVGIVARVQPHRRFDLLWEVAALVCGAEPGARFVLLGRGDQGDLEKLCLEPVERLGLRRNVLFPGYLYGDRYPPALRSLDAFLFLVPGSDGTCRAVREAFATGLAVVSTDLGILPELVGRGERGFAVPARADDLAQELLRLARDRAHAGRLSAEARRYAVEDLSPARHARALLGLYRRVLGGGA